MKIIGEKMIDINDKQNRFHINKIRILEEELIRTSMPKYNEIKVFKCAW